ncbi:MAG: hypothetical protein RLZZ293_1185 [Pseudomonadota bacterium]|jgi:UDP-2,3-diacylglucosamine hydrolase
MQKIVFISDLHLAPDTPEKNQLFYQLLASWHNKLDALYILGDFFDYWLGDDDDNPFIRQMRIHLSAFGKTTPIYFRGGNHDFALGKKFAKQCKMQLIPDLYCLELDNQRVLLSHGDTFCSLDIAYQKMKKILQNPLLLFILRRIPLSWRYKIKQKLETKSHAKNNSKPEYIYHVVDNTIIQFAHQAQANIVIHGHTHRPGIYSLSLNDRNRQDLIRYELPDWQDHQPGGYLIYENNQFKFNSIGDN